MTARQPLLLHLANRLGPKGPR